MSVFCFMVELDLFIYSLQIMWYLIPKYKNMYNFHVGLINILPFNASVVFVFPPSQHRTNIWNPLGPIMMAPDTIHNTTLKTWERKQNSMHQRETYFLFLCWNLIKSSICFNTPLTWLGDLLEGNSERDPNVPRKEKRFRGELASVPQGNGMLGKR